MKFNQLDETAWLKFSEETCNVLGKLVVQEARKAFSKYRVHFITIPVPLLPEGLTVQDLPLEVRTYNCLLSHRNTHFINEKFAENTLMDLMMMRNFGVKTLIDFLTSLEYTIRTYKEPIPAPLEDEKETIDPALIETFQAKLHELKNISYSDQIFSDDIRIWKYTPFIKSDSISLKDLAAALEQREFNSSEDVKYSIKIADDLCERVKNLAHLSLENELLDVVRSHTSDRNAKIYCMRYGWDGNGRKSLLATGSGLGMTQERARQICNKIDRKLQLQTATSFTPALNKVIPVLSELTPCLASEISAKLEQLHISESSFEISGLTHALETFTGKIYIIERIDGSSDEAVVPKEIEGVTKLLVSHAKKASRHWGAVQSENLTNQFERETVEGHEYSPPKSISIPHPGVISIPQAGPLVFPTFYK